MTSVLLAAAASSASSAGADDAGSAGVDKLMTSAGWLGVGAVAVLAYVQLSIAIRATPRMRWLHESVAAMLIGSTLALVVDASTSRARLSDDPVSRTFVALIFAPVFFNSGLTLRTGPLARRSRAVLLFAIAGSVVSATVFGGAAYGFARLAGVPDADLFECLMFGALVSSTDSISTVSLLLELDIEPLLYTVVLGESVLNDLVAVSLTTTFSGYVGTGHLTFVVLLHVLFDWVWKTLVSVLIGIAAGLAWVLLKCFQRTITLSSTYEIATMVPFGVLAYAASDAAGLSGVLALFVAIAVISHYSWYTVLGRTRGALYAVSATLDYIAQTAAFFMLGVTVFMRKDTWAYENWNMAFIVPCVVLVFAARAANVFPLSLLLNILGQNLSLKHQGALWLCGLRGVVTPLLAMSLTTTNRQLVINTAFIILLFTNVFLSASVRPLISWLKVSSTLDRESMHSRRRDAPTDDEGEGARYRRPPASSDSWISRNLSSLDQKIIELVRHRSARRAEPDGSPASSAAARRARRFRGKDRGVHPELDLARAPSKPHHGSAMSRSAAAAVQGESDETPPPSDVRGASPSLDIERLVKLKVIVEQPSSSSSSVQMVGQDITKLPAAARTKSPMREIQVVSAALPPQPRAPAEEEDEDEDIEQDQKLTSMSVFSSCRDGHNPSVENKRLLGNSLDTSEGPASPAMRLISPFQEGRVQDDEPEAPEGAWEEETPRASPHFDVPLNPRGLADDLSDEPDI
eukprot:m51a1_g1211 putative sodium hydrogen (746) ;mRNA; r:478462-481046